MIARVVLAGLLVLAAPTLEDCGAQHGTGGGAKAAKSDGCPPSVMWMQPNYGTVTKTRDCPGFFGTGTVRYAYVNGDIADGWVADHSKLCGRGDNWVGGSGCG